MYRADRSTLPEQSLKSSKLKYGDYGCFTLVAGEASMMQMRTQ